MTSENKGCVEQMVYIILSRSGEGEILSLNLNNCFDIYENAMKLQDFLGNLSRKKLVA